MQVKPRMKCSACFRSGLARTVICKERLPWELVAFRLDDVGRATHRKGWAKGEARPSADMHIL